ncbi:unnamed protein product, partial [Prorocentrum cordatum]
AGAAGAQLLGPRGVGKAPTSSRARRDFVDLIFTFGGYCGLLGWAAGLELPRGAEGPLAAEQIGEQGTQVGKSSCHLLASTTKFTAQSIAKLCPRGDGQAEERAGKERFAEVLIAWDELISRHERATGEGFTQNTKTSAIVAHAPDDAKTTLRSAQGGARSDAAQMRNCILEAVIGQSGAISRPPAAGRGSGDMGVDAIPKGGNGKDNKDKCHICHKPNNTARDGYWRDKGKGKSDVKCRGAGAGGKQGVGRDGKGKRKDVFIGQCDYCHQTGNKNTDCRKRIADETAKSNAAIEQDSTGPKTVAKIEFAEYEREICDDDQPRCVATRPDDADAECCAMDGTAFVALDTAGDCHVGPTTFGEGCRKVADNGPTLLDAQRQDIMMDSIATAPMAVDDDNEQTKLLQADFRLGDTASKPILSLFEVRGKGAEF